MSLKHYLRGLGIGILVTAVISGFSGEEELSDAEIKIRAARLGMVEESRLSDLNQTEEQSKSDEELENANKNSSDEKAETKEEAAEEDLSKEDRIPSTKEETSVDSTQNDLEIEVPLANEITTMVEEYIVFSIESGSSGSKIAKELHEAGLIESAEEYDRYLRDTGYSRQLQAGPHRIPVGASEEEITKILCDL